MWYDKPYQSNWSTVILGPCAPPEIPPLFPFTDSSSHKRKATCSPWLYWELTVLERRAVGKMCYNMETSWWTWKKLIHCSGLVYSSTSVFRSGFQCLLDGIHDIIQFHWFIRILVEFPIYQCVNGSIGMCIERIWVKGCESALPVGFERTTPLVLHKYYRLAVCFAFVLRSCWKNRWIHEARYHCSEAKTFLCELLLVPMYVCGVCTLACTRTGNSDSHHEIERLLYGTHTEQPKWYMLHCMGYFRFSFRSDTVPVVSNRILRNSLTEQGVPKLSDAFVGTNLQTTYTFLR